MKKVMGRENNISFQSDVFLNSECLFLFELIFRNASDPAIQCVAKIFISLYSWECLEGIIVGPSSKTTKSYYRSWHSETNSFKPVYLLLQ